MDEQKLTTGSDSQTRRGWLLVFVCLFTLTIGTTMFATFGLVIGPMSREFGVGIDFLSGALSLSLFSAAICAPGVGRWLDSGSIRRILSIGLLLIACAIFLVTRVGDRLVLLCVFFFIVGPGTALLTPMVPAKLVNNWFQKNRGIALAVVALPLGSVLGPLIGGQLVQTYGWRVLYYVVAAALVVALVLVQLIRNTPAESEQQGEPALENFGNDSVPSLVVYLSLLKNVRFWIIVVYFAALMSGVGTLITHLVVHTTSKGLGLSQGAVILSLFNAFGMVGVVILGWCLDRAWGFLAIFIAGLAFSILSLILFHNPGTYVSWLIVAAMAGLSKGGLFIGYATFVTRLLGAETFGTAVGLGTTIILLIGSGTPFLAGVVYERLGSYAPYFSAQMIVVVILSVAMWFFVKPSVILTADGGSRGVKEGP